MFCVPHMTDIAEERASWETFTQVGNYAEAKNIIILYLDNIVINYNKILDLADFHCKSKYNCFVLWTDLFLCFGSGEATFDQSPLFVEIGAIIENRYHYLSPA